MVNVLYVDSECFLAEFDAGICYVEYPYASSVVQAGDQVVITYDSKDLYAATPDKKLGGYQWECYLLKMKDLEVK